MSRSIALLACVAWLAACTKAHTRRIPVRPIPAPEGAAVQFEGVLVPTTAKFTIADAPEGSWLHVVKVNDHFELAGDLAGTYHNAFRTKLNERGTSLAPVAGGAPWEQKLGDGQYALQATIETVEIANVLKNDGLHVVPGELTFNMVTFYRLYRSGDVTPFVKFQSGPYTWTTKKRNIEELLPQILLSTADFAARCLQGTDFNTEGLAVDCRFVRKAIDEEQTKAVSKIDASLAAMEASGDHAGALLALASAYKGGCNSQGACNAIFERIVKTLAKLPARPPLSEEGRRLMIQAEAAAKEKRYDDAISLFTGAARECPWHPDAFFNAAVMYGEQQRYEEASRFMKRFVSLMQGTPDARKAQDKIYEWEGKVKATPPK